MGIEKKAFLVCDRCGGRIEVDEGSVMFDVVDKHPGWTRVRDRALCPECSPQYEVMVARHTVEIDDYLNGR